MKKISEFTVIGFRWPARAVPAHISTAWMQSWDVLFGMKA